MTKKKTTKKEIKAPFTAQEILETLLAQDKARLEKLKALRKENNELSYVIDSMLLFIAMMLDRDDFMKTKSGTALLLDFSLNKKGVDYAIKLAQKMQLAQGLIERLKETKKHLKAKPDAESAHMSVAHGALDMLDNDSPISHTGLNMYESILTFLSSDFSRYITRYLFEQKDKIDSLSSIDDMTKLAADVSEHLIKKEYALKGALKKLIDDTHMINFEQIDRLLKSYKNKQ